MVLTKCTWPINSNITICKTSLHILQTALPPNHNTQAYTVPKTPQPVLLASTGALGVLKGMGCPLLPQGTSEKRSDSSLLPLQTSVLDFLPCLGLGWLPDERSGKVSFVSVFFSFNHTAGLASCSESIYFSSAIRELELQQLQLWLVPVWLWDHKHLTDGTGPEYGLASGEGLALTLAALLMRDVHHLLPTPLVGQNNAFHVVPPTQTTIYSHHCTQSSSSLGKVVLEKHSQTGGGWTAAWCLINILRTPNATRFYALCVSQVLYTTSWRRAEADEVVKVRCESNGNRYMYIWVTLKKTISKTGLWWGRELCWSSFLSLTASSNTFLHHIVTAHLERHS